MNEQNDHLPRLVKVMVKTNQDNGMGQDAED